MIQVSHYTFDPTGLDVSGVAGGRAEQGDVFADIFGQNFELASRESNSSLWQRPERANEQQGSEMKNEPVVVADDVKSMADDASDADRTEDTKNADKENADA